VRCGEPWWTMDTEEIIVLFLLGTFAGVALYILGAYVL
jgi:hypothetical protein